MYLFAISIELALIFIFEEGLQLGGAVNIAGLTCLGKAGAIVTVINAVMLGGVIYVTIILVRGAERRLEYYKPIIRRCWWCSEISPTPRGNTLGCC